MEQRNADGLGHSIDADNGSQRTDRHFALHRFLETVEIAETAFSGPSPPSTPHFSAIQMSSHPCPSLPPLSPMQEEEVVSPSPHPPSHASAISNLSGRDVQRRQTERLRLKHNRFSLFSIVNDVVHTNKLEPCEGQRRHSLSPVRVSAGKTSVETAEVVVVAKNGSKSQPAKPRKKASVEPLGDRTWTNGVVTPPGNRKRIRDPEISSPSLIHTNAAKETVSPCPAGRNISEIPNGCSSPLRRQPAQKRAARSREGIIVEKALPNLPKVTSSNVVDDAQSFLTKDSAAGEFVASTGRMMGVLNPPPRVGLQYKSRSHSKERFVSPKAAKKARRDKYEPELHDQVFTTRNSTTSPELLETVDSGISPLALHESTTSDARKKDRHHKPKSGAVRSPLEGKDDAARVKRKRADFQGDKNQLPAKVRKQKTLSSKNFQDTSREILDESQEQPRRIVQEWLVEQSTGDFLVPGVGNDPLGSDRSDDEKPLHDGSRNGHLPEDCLSWANSFDNRIRPSSTHPTSSDTINTALTGFRGATEENRYDAARSENDEKYGTTSPITFHI
jgi:hypothetical protein